MECLDHQYSIPYLDLACKKVVRIYTILFWYHLVQQKLLANDNKINGISIIHNRWPFENAVVFSETNFFFSSERSWITVTKNEKGMISLLNSFIGLKINGTKIEWSNRIHQQWWGSNAWVLSSSYETNKNLSPWTSIIRFLYVLQSGQTWQHLLFTTMINKWKTRN